MDHFWTSIVTVATGIIGIAIIAVLVSKNANTSGVISSAAGGFAQDLEAAVSPVTGGGNGLSNFGGFTGGGAGGYQQFH